MATQADEGEGGREGKRKGGGALAKVRSGEGREGGREGGVGSVSCPVSRRVQTQKLTNIFPPSLLPPLLSFPSSSLPSSSPPHSLPWPVPPPPSSFPPSLPPPRQPERRLRHGSPEEQRGKGLASHLRFLLPCHLRSRSNCLHPLPRQRGGPGILISREGGLQGDVNNFFQEKEAMMYTCLASFWSFFFQLEGGREFTKSAQNHELQPC